ncbi:hypothetical protein L596_025519 [Steinernema carpocapsae]|uniref:Uncharacterized protein n=1 Tax=Steinernema carpocapsae TaxID=34508 RepID=A0A4U5M804_STECR|nr:hypothetical protein L596_025519 [Steinernema carpocapsae]
MVFDPKFQRNESFLVSLAVVTKNHTKIDNQHSRDAEKYVIGSGKPFGNVKQGSRRFQKHQPKRKNPNKSKVSGQRMVVVESHGKTVEFQT